MSNATQAEASGIGTPYPPLPRELSDALKAIPGPIMLHQGQTPIHPNEVQITANENEVILTYALVSGEGTLASPRVVQEVCKLVMSWSMLEMQHRIQGRLLVQSVEMREEALEKALKGAREAAAYWREHKDEADGMRSGSTRLRGSAPVEDESAATATKAKPTAKRRAARPKASARKRPAKS